MYQWGNDGEMSDYPTFCRERSLSTQNYLKVEIAGYINYYLKGAALRSANPSNHEINSILHLKTRECTVVR